MTTNFGDVQVSVERVDVSNVLVGDILGDFAVDIK